ncbi:GGDEF domain-containing protein [Candidatus Nomurabacteria bacterium]|nr:GGDEF domain-containing protein [Candidatus Nomurabacteria bacterium]
MVERIMDRPPQRESERVEGIIEMLCEPFPRQLIEKLAFDDEKRNAIIAEAEEIQRSLVKRVLISKLVEGVERQEAQQVGLSKNVLDDIRESILSDTTDRPAHEVVSHLIDETTLNSLAGNIERSIQESSPFSPSEVDAITANLRPTVRELSPYILQTAVEKVELEQKEYQDELTGGLSKKGLEHHFDIEREKLDQKGTEGERLVLVFFDIDGFKKINDDPARGHLVGDQIIQEVVQKLRAGLRGVDSVGRRSGDEFLLVLPGVGSESVDTVLQKVQELVRGVSDRAGGQVSVTGGARVIAPREQVQFSRAADEADRAAIFEKINEPGGIRVYSEELRPDVSTAEKRRMWAAKVAQRDLKRQSGELDMLMSRTEDERTIRLLQAEKELLEQEISLRIERGLVQMEREFGPFEN